MIVDRLGQEIRLGDRVLYPRHGPGQYGIGTVNYVSESVIDVKPETEYTWLTDDSVRISDVIRSSDVCVVLNQGDPRVTVELLRV